MRLEDRLQRVAERHAELGQALVDPSGMDSGAYAAASKEYAELSPIVRAFDELTLAEQEEADLRSILADSGTDIEMRELAEDELHEVKKRIEDSRHQIRVLLLPRDEADDRNAILEVRAGTGGEEASLFAAELFRMYQRYAENHRWRFEIMEMSETGLGGLKEGIASLSGKGVFARLKFESGVHRVQRVPETESGGRIHTSAATVAVLPEAEEVDVHVDENDLRIDVYRSSGPGGQSVNTTDSAVRITHLPTGIVVMQQDEKSQHKNRAKAMKILRARLFDLERSRLAAERAASRRTQVGSGDRSERIRTYNFPQSRVTDHRIGLTLHKLDRIVAGELDELINALIAEDHAARMADAE